MSLGGRSRQVKHFWPKIHYPVQFLLRVTRYSVDIILVSYLLLVKYYFV